jgi:hypothetical protein
MYEVSCNPKSIYNLTLHTFSHGIRLVSILTSAASATSIPALPFSLALLHCARTTHPAALASLPLCSGVQLPTPATFSYVSWTSGITFSATWTDPCSITSYACSAPYCWCHSYFASSESALYDYTCQARFPGPGSIPCSTIISTTQDVPRCPCWS